MNHIILANQMLRDWSERVQLRESHIWWQEILVRTLLQVDIKAMELS